MPNIEHFPELVDVEVVRCDDRSVLVGVDSGGSQYVATNLVFHGGQGDVLEMRIFGLEDLVSCAKRAGFVEVEVHDEEVPASGIIWQIPNSFPILLRIAS